MPSAPPPSPAAVSRLDSEAFSLSVVLPAYNEAERLGATLDTLCDYFEGRPGEVEILVVDDGSTDGTAELGEERLGARRVPFAVLTGRANRGKGYSVREGALAARRAWTLVSDADLSTPIDDVEKLLAVARRDRLDFVAGSRALAGSEIGLRQSWLRENMGRTFNRILRPLTGLHFRDTQCGFKLWRTEPLRPILQALTIDGFAWDVEMLLAAQRAGLRMAEVPVRWNNAAGSKVAIVGDSFRMLVDVVRIRLRSRR
jgi:glycosyltransferase involved in cell wall biosynthesis